MTEYVTTQQFDSFRAEEDRHHEANEKEIANIRNDITGIRKTLFGNGIPGWDEMLRDLYADYLERKEADKEQRKADKETDKQTKLQKVVGSWQFQIALMNGIFLAIIEIVKAYAK